MATTPSASAAAPAQPPVELLYMLPIGAVVPWFPPPTAYQADPSDPSGQKKLVMPPGFLLCDGGKVNDQESPFNGMPVPNLIGRFALGTDGSIPLGQRDGCVNFNTQGWQNGEFITQPTAAEQQDNQGNSIIQNGGQSTSWRYVLTTDDLSKNDGNHHHLVPANTFSVPAPGYVAFLMIIRVK